MKNNLVPILKYQASKWTLNNNNTAITIPIRDQLPHFHLSNNKKNNIFAKKQFSASEIVNPSTVEWRVNQF